MISIIVTCYNHIDYTIKFLESLPGNTTSDYEIILVDDASTDKTSLLKEKDFGIDKLIRHDKNLGMPKGINDGVAIAEGKYLALFNNDILMSNDWDSPLISALTKYPYLGMVGGNAVMTEQAFLNYNKVNTIIVWEKGHPFFFLTSVHKEIGEWDEQFYPTWYDDNDFLIRAALKKYKFAAVNNSFCFHYGHVTIGQDELPDWKNFKELSRRKLIKKWGLPLSLDIFWIDYEKIYNIGVVKSCDLKKFEMNKYIIEKEN